MSDIDKPSQNSGCSEQPMDYLAKAAEACSAGDFTLGMHLYLAAYEKAVSDPHSSTGVAVAALRELGGREEALGAVGAIRELRVVRVVAFRRFGERDHGQRGVFGNAGVGVVGKRERVALAVGGADVLLQRARPGHEF